MAFLTPLFLFGLLAVAIPLGIHLIRRDKPPKILFSTLRFFQQRSRKQFLFQKLQQWLLLLLRAAVISLLVLAFARPFFGQSLSNWADLAPRSVVLLMDVSMSMGYRDYLEKAKSAANSIIADLNPGDEATLILFSDKVESVHGPSSDVATLSDLVAGVNSPGFEATRYFAPLRLADEMLADSRFEDKSVYLISDFQSNGMSEFDTNWKLKPGVQLLAENVGDKESRNLAITGVKSPAYLRTSKQEDELFVRVRTLGSVRQDEAEVSVNIGGEEQFRDLVDLREQSEAVIRVPVSFAGEGSHVGRVEVADENFDADNAFYFTVDVLPKIPVLVVNGEASRNWYEDEAHWFGLAVSSNEQSPFSVSTTEPPAFDGRDLRKHKVVVLLNVGQLAGSQAEALRQFVEDGGSVLIAPADQVEASSFNQRLGAISPAMLAPRASLAPNEYLLIAEVENRHPVLRPLEIDWSARFSQSWLLKPDASSQVLMKFDDGTPALVERQLGQGRALIFASSLDLEWNNLPLQGMYLPLVHETLKYLANTAEKKPSYRVGEKVQLPNGGRAADIRDPGGRALALQEGDDSFTLREPGVYSSEGEGQSVYFAANRPVEESDFSSISPAVIVDQVVNPETAPAQSLAVRSQVLKLELERPQRLWWWLLAAVTLMLMVESFVANRTYR